MTDDHNPGGKVKIKLSPDIVGSAVFSPDRKYRYSLSRVWDLDKSCCLFVMMNPSTADALHNDPTIAKCIRYASAWGCGSMLVANICAYRATDKRALLLVADPVGPDNDAHLMALAQQKSMSIVVMAYGQLPVRLRHIAGATVTKLVAAGIELSVLRLAMDGTPCHPLYLPGDLVPVTWRHQEIERVAA
jgi:hypothetical protein